MRDLLAIVKFLVTIKLTNNSAQAVSVTHNITKTKSCSRRSLALSTTCRLKAVLQLLAVVCLGDTDIRYVESQYGGRADVMLYRI